MPRPHAVLDYDQVDAIRQQYAAGGITQQELADTYGTSVMTINRIIRGTTWPDPDYTPPAPHTRVIGEGNGVAKLTWNQVRMIRQRYGNPGVTTITLANRYGVSKMAISRVIRNQAWHDPDYTPPQR